MNQLEHDIYNATMYKLACYAEEMEKIAGRTYKDPLNRLYNQIQHNSWARYGRGPSEAVTNKIIQKLKADPLVAKQFIGRAIDNGTKQWNFLGGQARFDGNLKALLFNKHKKDILPAAIKDLADVIHSGFNMNGGLSFIEPKLADPLEKSSRPFYDEIMKVFKK